MGLGTTYSIAMCGLEASRITVEADCGRGLPAIHIIGKADTAVRESGERVRSALLNTHLDWPRTRLTLALSPAEIPKIGAHFDVAIALAVLIAQGAIPALPPDTIVLGELGLDGRVLPVTGVLPMAVAALNSGATRLIVPRDNYVEAALVEGLTIHPIEDIKQVVTALQCHVLPVADSTLTMTDQSSRTTKPVQELVDFHDLRGQREAVDASLIAAAGGHHLLMLGPPGAGKSMLAQRLPTIMPKLSQEAALEATAIHSLCGRIDAGHPLLTTPPFVAPHPGLTGAALIGGGSGVAGPGAISLAHHGILFLDECTEIPRNILDLLRTPLQEGEIRITRARGTVCYPSQFQLVLAGNSCPCGAATARDCRCSVTTRERYRARLSEPLIDRIDIRLRLAPIGLAAVSASHNPPSEHLRQIVSEAQERAHQRWGVNLTNAAVSTNYLDHHPLSSATLRPIYPELQSGELSARGLSRLIRLAWTIADLADHPQPTAEDMDYARRLRAPLSDL